MLLNAFVSTWVECEMAKTERWLQREPLKRPDHTGVRVQKSDQVSLAVDIVWDHLHESDTAAWISDIFQLLPASWMILFTHSVLDGEILIGRYLCG